MKTWCLRAVIQRVLLAVVSCMILPAGISSAAPAALEIRAGEVTGFPGETVQVPVYLSSNGLVAGVQLDLGYGSQLLTYQGIVKGELTQNFTVIANETGGKVRVIIYSADGSSIPDGSGTVAELTFKVAAAAQAGQNCALELNGVVLSDAQGNNITPGAAIKNGQFTVSGDPGAGLELKAGEVTGAPGETVKVPVYLNSSGQVAGMQVDLGYGSQLLDYQGINKGELTQNFTVTANKIDGKVRVIIYSADGSSIPEGSGVVAELTFNVATAAQAGRSCALELNGVVLSDAEGNNITPGAAIKNGQFTVSGDPGAGLEIKAGEVTGTTGETVQVPVYLSSNGQVAGVQLDLGYGSQLLTYQGINKGELTQNFTVIANETGGKVRVIIYNADGSSIPGGSGTVAELTFKVAAAAQAGQNCALGLSGVVLSDAEGNNITSGAAIKNGQFTVSGSLPDYGAIAGKVDLEGLSPGQYDIVAINIIDSGGNVITTGYSGSGGDFNVTGIPEGTYFIKFTANKYLVKKESNVVVFAGEVTGMGTIKLTVGDVNNDNKVNLIDLILTANAYGKTKGQPGYNESCDFNNDDAVNLADLVYMSKSYGMYGDQ